MARDTVALEKFFGSDAQMGRKVVDHLLKSNDQLKKNLAGQIIVLGNKLTRLQVLKTHSKVKASKVDKLAGKFSSLLSAIGRKAKNKPSTVWIIPRSVAISVQRQTMKADRLLSKPPALKRPLIKSLFLRRRKI